LRCCRRLPHSADDPSPVVDEAKEHKKEDSKDDAAKYDSMTSVGLKEECRKRKLKDDGLKDALIKRLEDDDKEKAVGGGGGGGSDGGGSKFTKRDLEDKRVSELEDIAKDAGVDKRELEKALDGRNAKEDVFEMILAASDGGGGEGGGSKHSKRDLEDKRVSELEDIAKDAGVDKRELDKAMDGRNAKEDVIELILAAGDGAAASPTSSTAGSSRAESPAPARCGPSLHTNISGLLSPHLL
jgi:DNA-binding phage protein